LPAGSPPRLNNVVAANMNRNVIVFITWLCHLTGSRPPYGGISRIHKLESISDEIACPELIGTWRSHDWITLKPHGVQSACALALGFGDAQSPQGHFCRMPGWRLRRGTVRIYGVLVSSNLPWWLGVWAMLSLKIFVPNIPTNKN
jgi:hypothetical protein